MKNINKYQNNDLFNQDKPRLNQLKNYTCKTIDDKKVYINKIYNGINVTFNGTEKVKNGYLVNDAGDITKLKVVQQRNQSYENEHYSVMKIISEYDSIKQITNSDNYKLKLTGSTKRGWQSGIEPSYAATLLFVIGDGEILSGVKPNLDDVDLSSVNQDIINRIKNFTACNGYWALCGDGKRKDSYIFLFKNDKLIQYISTPSGVMADGNPAIVEFTKDSNNPELKNGYGIHIQGYGDTVISVNDIQFEKEPNIFIQTCKDNIYSQADFWSYWYKLYNIKIEKI